MTFKDCINFANKVKDCAMATVEEGQPRVRMMGLWFADESGFYFQAWNFKGVYKQLEENKAIEICFFDKSKEGPYDVMRLRGKAEFMPEAELKKKVMEDRPFLRKLGAKDDDPRIVVFRIPHGEASFWPLKNEKEGEYPGLDMLNF
jgi:uncharacterized pyridoxamine 5'-phosphate oxidase family protein